jgi:hypothetical protein
MSEVRFLLKFGKKKHIEEFVDGSLYCSNAETFWGIEKDKKIKGQGDILEAGSRMFAQRMTMQEHDTGNITEYSCAMKSHFQKSGNQMTGRWKSSCASLLA